MKGLKKIVLLLLLTILGMMLLSCKGTEDLKYDYVSYTVSWGGEDGEINYQGLAHHKEYGWVTSRDFYTLDGIYALPGGRGSKIFDSMGNLVKGSTVESGETYYANWKPINIVLCLDLPDDASFEDGSNRKEFLVEYTGTLPSVFPAAKDEVGLDLGRWHIVSVTDEYGNLLEGKGTVADYCTAEPTENTPYVIRLAPYVNYEDDNAKHTLTFDFGGGIIDRHVVESYTDIPPQFFWYGENADRELVGWATYPTERGEFVTEIDNLVEDITLYAIWKQYRTIRLHLHDNKVKTVRVYKDEPFLLDEAAALVGTEFENWYEDSNFDTVASRIVTYEGTVTDYYAKFNPKSELSGGSYCLTLAYGDGVSEEFEIKPGQSIENCLWYETTDGRELIGWSNGGDDFVTGGTIEGDTTLVASWKNCRVVQLHMYGDFVWTIHIYEGESYYLRDLPNAADAVFDDWYSDSSYTRKAPTEIDFENALAHYYAKHERY